MMRKLKSLKQTITEEQLRKVQNESRRAKDLLSHPDFQFFRDYLQNGQKSIEQTFARQSINDAWTEVYTYSGAGVIDRVRKIFFPAKKEYSSLAGQYKFVEQLLADLDNYSRMEDDLKKQRDAGAIEITESKE